MPKKEKIQLENFESWLVQGDGKSPGTARTYASNIRQVIKEVGEGDITDRKRVESYFEILKVEQPRKVPGRQVAWRAFCRWLESEKGFDLEKTEQAPGSLPESVRTAIRTVKNGGVSYKSLHWMRWADVDLEGGYTARKDAFNVRNPLTQNEYFQISGSAIMALLEYARPGNDIMVPLIPLEPGSNTPYPYSALLKEVHLGEESLEEKVRRYREKHLLKKSGNVSALGASSDTLDEEEQVTPKNYKSKFLKDGEKLESLEKLLDD